MGFHNFNFKKKTPNRLLTHHPSLPITAATKTFLRRALMEIVLLRIRVFTDRDASLFPVP